MAVIGLLSASQLTLSQAAQVVLRYDALVLQCVVALAYRHYAVIGMLPDQQARPTGARDTGDVTTPCSSATLLRQAALSSAASWRRAGVACNAIIVLYRFTRCAIITPSFCILKHSDTNVLYLRLYIINYLV
jgi:hypothetical protein